MSGVGLDPNDRVHEKAHLQRAAAGCLCCGSTALRRASTLVSGFMASRAWGGASEVIDLVTCAECGFRFFDRGLAPDEANRYYQGYRDETYYEARHAFEPFYMRRHWRADSDWLASKERKADLAAILQSAGLLPPYGSVLDYGGGTGHLVSGLDAAYKAVCDVSNEPAHDGVERLDLNAVGARRWDIVVSAHVFEHLSDPQRCMHDIARWLDAGGAAYIEVPDEIWKDWGNGSRARTSWLRWLTHHPGMAKLADTYSTVCRVLTGVLPPFGFTPMREHLNYFTSDALQALARRSGLTPVSVTKNNSGHFCMVARKAASA